jgi:hypothetical protein
MSLFSPIWCVANHHDPVRREAEWDGRGYIGTCRHCGAAIYRHKHRDWRAQSEGWAERRDAEAPRIQRR